MKTEFVALCLGVMVAGGAVAVVACGSTGDDTGTVPPKPDTGKDTGIGTDTGTPPDDTGTPTDTGTPDDTGTPTDTGTPGDTGSDACKPPGKLYPPKADAGDFYCPFVAPAKTYCKNGTEHCCEPSTGSSTCTPIATACAAGTTDWQCDDPSECPSGQKCCGIGKLVISPDPACENYASGFKGTHCKTACDPSTEIEMCTSAGECTGGTTCTPFSTKGSAVGGCH
jgi:hypothetical protein